MVPLRLSETCTGDRPRERLFKLGPTALTTAELLAILLGTGTRRQDALAVASGLLGEHGGTLRQLARRPAAALWGGGRQGGAGRCRPRAGAPPGGRDRCDPPGCAVPGGRAAGVRARA